VAKKNLLQIVQDILSAMNSDPVNSITDTREATQVAEQCARVFYTMTSNRVWPANKQLATLDASGEAARPAMMRLKEAVTQIESVYYDCRKAITDPPEYREVKRMEYVDFLEHLMLRNPSNPNVLTMMDVRGTPLFVLNDSSPSYYTSFDDEWLIFDSYDSVVDTTLQSSKTQVLSLVEPEFTVANDFIPPVPTHLFSYYENECLAWCFVIIKQMVNDKVEATVLEQKGYISRNKHRVGGYSKYPDYGRKSRK
jgi:hypothetical protein